MPESQPQAVHDWLLANQPAGAVHDADSCALCAPGGTHESSGGGAMTAAVDDKTFNQSDIDAAVAKAVADATAPLSARLAEHEGAAAEAAFTAKVDAAVKAAVEPLQTQVDELTKSLDEQTIAANTEKARADGLEQLIEQAGKDAEEQAALAERTTERLAKIKELAVFTDEQLDEKAVADGPTRAERYVAMSDEAFEAAVEALELHKGAAATQGPPRKTALVASADEGKPGGGKGALSPARQLAATRAARFGNLGSMVGR